MEGGEAEDEKTDLTGRVMVPSPRRRYGQGMEIIRGISVAPGVAILSAVAGLIPPPQDDIVPALNAIQTLVAVARDGVWQAELFQNTPAQFHGRPELADALTARLRATLRKPGAHG